MKRVLVIHWKQEDEGRYAGLRESTSYCISFQVPQGTAFLRQVREEPPDAFIVDLSRLPSQGRDVALALRKYKATRHVPLVLAGGEPAKVAAIRKMIPDAVYASWEEIQAALQEAIAHPPQDPIVPRTVLDGYSGTPLTKKLGIKPDSVVGLIEAPGGFSAELEGLPEGVLFSHQAETDCERILWFVRDRAGLKAGLGTLAGRSDFRALWILWPKKASGVPSDLSQQVVREAGMAAGFVDYKICSVNPIWSGLLFARRKNN